MDPLTVTFAIAAPIAKGLASGIYERYGGVIRDTATKQVVTWLREYAPGSVKENLPTPSDPSSFINLVVSGVNTTATGANVAITSKGFSDVNQHLGGIEQQISGLQHGIQHAQGILQVTSAASRLWLE
uniref:hypothetical protein n=1 Tax=Trichocoleus desertorum TaxID=1481672 RepID=UPI0025B53B69|nr:hypothetical protein [Trichocoleus desertorum]